MILCQKRLFELDCNYLIQNETKSQITLLLNKVRTLEYTYNLVEEYGF